MAAIIIYSDLSFNPNKSRLNGKDINVSCVVSSIKNILGTKLRERLNNPEFGCNLDNYLFELMDDLTAFKIKEEFKNAINRWDTRVLINNSETYVHADPDNNKYKCQLAFTVRGFENEMMYLNFSVAR